MASRTIGTAQSTTIEPRTNRSASLARQDLRAVRARQREQFGGINWGAACFGWLVALALGAILAGVLAATGVVVGLTAQSADEVFGDAKSTGLGGAVAVLVALAIAYGCGGYVAGRMSRFDGARQGAATWTIGVLVIVAVALAGAILGAEYDVLGRLDLPTLTIGDFEPAMGGALALLAVVAVTLLTAIAGGKSGARYHHKIDRAGLVKA
jgi:hypothetical protein